MIMTPEHARELLAICVEQYNKGAMTALRMLENLYDFAAVIEPAEIVAAVPEGVRLELQKEAARPLPKFGEEVWIIVGAIMPGKDPEEDAKRSMEVDKERYRGRCRLHEYLNRTV
jgi:hypothetical protein